MAATSGANGNVKIGTNAVADLGNWKMDLGADLPETTAFSSAGWKEFIAGLKEWSGSSEGNFNMADTNGQLALQNALLNGTTVALKLYVDGTHYYSGNAFVKKVSPETPVGDKVKVSFDFQGTGALAYT